MVNELDPLVCPVVGHTIVHHNVEPVPLAPHVDQQRYRVAHVHGTGYPGTWTHVQMNKRRKSGKLIICLLRSVHRKLIVITTGARGFKSDHEILQLFQSVQCWFGFGLQFYLLQARPNKNHNFSHFNQIGFWSFFHKKRQMSSLPWPTDMSS